MRNYGFCYTLGYLEYSTVHRSVDSPVTVIVKSGQASWVQLYTNVTFFRVSPGSDSHLSKTGFGSIRRPHLQ